MLRVKSWTRNTNWKEWWFTRVLRKEDIITHCWKLIMNGSSSMIKQWLSSVLQIWKGRLLEGLKVLMDGEIINSLQMHISYSMKIIKNSKWSISIKNKQIKTHKSASRKPYYQKPAFNKMNKIIKPFQRKDNQQAECLLKNH